jgi:tetratricopeptide (TPR) repeat protein
LTLVCHWFIAPAQAEDDFARGCRLYNAKDYKQAAPALSEAVRKFPNFWPGHYYLAHTFLALGQRGAARKEYEACLTSLPPPGADVAGACQKVIGSLGGSAPAASAPQAGSIPAGESKAASADAGDKAGEPESLRDKEKRWHVERLKKQCAEKIAALRAEEAEALNGATTKWVRDGDNRRLVVQPDIGAAIEKEYAEKISKVQEATERDIAAVH